MAKVIDNVVAPAPATVKRNILSVEDSRFITSLGSWAKYNDGSLSAVAASRSWSSSSGSTVTITADVAGSAGNNIQIDFQEDFGFGGGVTVFTSQDLISGERTIHVEYDEFSVTNQQVVDAINGHATASSWVNASMSNGSATFVPTGTTFNAFLQGGRDSSSTAPIVAFGGTTSANALLVRDATGTTGPNFFLTNPIPNQPALSLYFNTGTGVFGQSGISTAFTIPASFSPDVYRIQLKGIFSGMFTGTSAQNWGLFIVDLDKGFVSKLADFGGSGTEQGEWTFYWKPLTQSSNFRLAIHNTSGQQQQNQNSVVKLVDIVIRAVDEDDLSYIKWYGSTQAFTTGVAANLTSFGTSSTLAGMGIAAASETFNNGIIGTPSGGGSEREVKSDGLYEFEFHLAGTPGANVAGSQNFSVETYLQITPFGGSAQNLQIDYQVVRASTVTNASIVWFGKAKFWMKRGTRFIPRLFQNSGQTVTLQNNSNCWWSVTKID